MIYLIITASLIDKYSITSNNATNIQKMPLLNMIMQNTSNIKTIPISNLSNKITEREQQYLSSISNTLAILHRINIKKRLITPIIVENNGQRATVLDTLNIHTHYTSTNSRKFIHKGVSELIDIKEVMKTYNIQDDDIVIKLTGRYLITHTTFFDTILATENEQYDAFVKFFNVCTKVFDDNDSVLGLFALRAKYLREFEYPLNKYKSAEQEFAHFVRMLKVREMNTLGLRYYFTDNTTPLDV
jgi:hypothetical protein